MISMHRATRFATAMVFGLLVVGCGGGGDEAGGETGGADGTAEPVQPPVDLSNAGTVTGQITFSGTPAEPEPIDMSQEQVCADKHDQQPMKRTAIVGPNGGLANVFVHVTEGIDQEWPTPNESKTLDQDGCIYHPHVFGIQPNQTLEIENSDGVLHNINTTPDQNRGFNISQPTEMTSERDFSQPEIMIPVRCDVHGWMEAYIGIVPHPYYAVSDSTGSFTLEDVPPGDYTLEAWHEEYGTRTAQVTVEPNGEATVEFAYDESMAGADVPLGEPFYPHAHAKKTVSSDDAVASAATSAGR